MAYIGAETPNDRLLQSIRKGTRSDQTLEVAELCRRNGVIPELSFMVAPPEDPGGRDRAHVRLHPPGQARESAGGDHRLHLHAAAGRAACRTAERLKLAPLRDVARRARASFRSTPEEWTERRWVDYACHADAPWMSERLRRRMRDFVTVLRCRFPTVQDTRSPGWAKARAARARELALFAAPLRPALGARVPRRTSSGCSIRASRASEVPVMHVATDQLLRRSAARVRRANCCADWHFAGTTSRAPLRHRRPRHGGAGQPASRALPRVAGWSTASWRRTAGGARAAAANSRSCFAELAPDVFHVHGLGFAREVRGLRQLCAAHADPAAGSCRSRAALLAARRLAQRRWPARTA